MKTVCFYRKFGGYVARLTDCDAAIVVAQKRGIYCPKHWYKAAKRIAEYEATT